MLLCHLIVHTYLVNIRLRYKFVTKIITYIERCLELVELFKNYQCILNLKS